MLHCSSDSEHHSCDAIDRAANQNVRAVMFCHSLARISSINRFRDRGMVHRVMVMPLEPGWTQNIQTNSEEEPAKF